MAELLRYVVLDATGKPNVVFDLNDMNVFANVRESFQITPPAKQAIQAASSRRYGGSYQVGETTDNGQVAWSILVQGVTADDCLVRVEALLTSLEANPFDLLLEWRPDGASESTLYEVRGTGTWTPKYQWVQFAGAQSMVFDVQIPVAPLAQGLPVQILSSVPTHLPAVFSLAGIGGDAPAKAEVSIQTDATLEEAFISGAHGPEGIAVSASFIYWANSQTGYIGRAELGGGKVEETWLHTEGIPTGVAIDAGHIYWTDAETNHVGRATLAGGSIEKAFITGASNPGPIAVNAGHIYWGNGGKASIGRATIAGAEVNQEFLKISFFARGIALDGFHLYWSYSRGIGRVRLGGEELNSNFITGLREVSGVCVNNEFLFWVNEGTNCIVRANLLGEEINEAWAVVADSFSFIPGAQLAVSKEFVYWTSGSPGSTIGRVAALSPPVWALLGWTSTPTTGLAPAPFGVFGGAEAISREFAYSAVADALNGSALITANQTAIAAWEVDPATMVPDSFSGELAVEAWARVRLCQSLGEATFTLSARPQDGIGYGAARYTDEWGSAGREVQLPDEEPCWRMTRLGTLHLLVNPLSPRIWTLWVEGEIENAGFEWFIDYLLLTPSSQRCCSPSGKPNNPNFPPFIQSVGSTVKTIRHDLSGLVSKPGKNGHPDHGLGGQLLELPPGNVDMLVKLSSLVPDNPNSSPCTEQSVQEAAVSVTVTPRSYLVRST